MAEVTEIHVVCRDREGVSHETSDSFESAAWDVKADHLRPGVLFALHQHRGAHSYLQGRIRSYTSRDDGRFIVTVEISGEALPWRGNGTGEIGFLWGGADWSLLPRIPLTIRDLHPGKNHPLKGLNEANPADFRYPRARSFRESRRANSNRQAAFDSWLLRIALCEDGHEVPYAFCDAAGEPYRLDDGAIGIAIPQGVLAEPIADPDQRVRRVYINDNYWRREEASGHLARLREQNHDLDGLGRDLFEEFDPTTVSIESIRRMLTTLREARIGQPDFRRRLIEAYGGRCAVTGCEVGAALEAAHIIPDSDVGDRGMDPRNGLLLRADVHSLFDAGLIGFRFDGEQLRMGIAPSLRGSEYEELTRLPVRIPGERKLRPSHHCIERRWEVFAIS